MRLLRALLINLSKKISCCIILRQLFRYYDYDKNKTAFNKKAGKYATSPLLGACDGTRTCDLLITNELHYQLCYTSIFRFGTLKTLVIITYEKLKSIA